MNTTYKHRERPILNCTCDYCGAPYEVHTKSKAAARRMGAVKVMGEWIINTKDTRQTCTRLECRDKAWNETAKRIKYEESILSLIKSVMK